MSESRRIQAPAPDRASRPGVADALDILEAALRAADPKAAVGRCLRVIDGRVMTRVQPDSTANADTVVDADAEFRDIGLGPGGTLLVVAAGKAAIGMIAAAEEILGDRIDAAFAVTVAGGREAAERAGLSRTTVFEAGHPLPDPAGLVAVRQLAKRLEALGQGDVAFVLLSGGASALLPLPSGRIPLIDLAAATSRLIGSAATIEEINTVRTHLTSMSGGGLVRLAYPARIETLILSDVVSGEHERVGSGPTTGDPTVYADAGRILSKYGLWGTMPASVGAHIRAGLAGQMNETPKPGDPIFAHSRVQVVGSLADALAGAARRAEELGYMTGVLDAAAEGEARDVGRLMAAAAKDVATGSADGPKDEDGDAVSPPACLLLGGETTVTFQRLPGKGGRNREFALSAAIELKGLAEVTLAAMGTDGIDFGPEAAGAVVDEHTLSRAEAAGLNAKDSLDGHDSGPFFEALGDAIVTGPTGTNVNDIVVALIGRPEGD